MRNRAIAMLCAALMGLGMVACEGGTANDDPGAGVGDPGAGVDDGTGGTGLDDGTGGGVDDGTDDL